MKGNKDKNSYRYPYIPKSEFPAVMYACKIIRGKGWYNKAIRIASRKYGVNEDVISKHVRARISAGVKAKYVPFSYKYFVVVDRYKNYDTMDYETLRYTVRRARNADNVAKWESTYVRTCIAEGSSKDGYDDLVEAEAVCQQIAESDGMEYVNEIAHRNNRAAAKREMNATLKKADKCIKEQGAYNQLTLVKVGDKWTTYEDETGIAGPWYDDHSEYFRCCGKSRAIVKLDGKYNIVDDNGDPLCKTWFENIKRGPEYFIASNNGQTVKLDEFGFEF